MPTPPSVPRHAHWHSPTYGAERSAVPHHFVDFIATDELYSAGQFESDALAWLDTWFATRRCAVLTGGSGLYVKAVLDGLDPVPADLDIRTQLNERFQKGGLEPWWRNFARLIRSMPTKWTHKIPSV